MAMPRPQSQRSPSPNPWNRIILSLSESIKTNDVHSNYSQFPSNTLALDLQFEKNCWHPLSVVQADLTVISTPAFSCSSASTKARMANCTWGLSGTSCFGPRNKFSQQSLAVFGGAAPALMGYPTQSFDPGRTPPVYSPPNYRRTIPPNAAALLNASDVSAPPDGDKDASSRSKLQLKTLRADGKHPPQRAKPCPPLEPLEPRAPSRDPPPSKQKKD